MIDSHVHIGGTEAGFLMNEEMILTSMEKYKIDISIVSNADSVEYADEFTRVPEEMRISQEKTLARVIKFVAKIRGKYTEHFGVNQIMKPSQRNLIK